MNEFKIKYLPLNLKSSLLHKERCKMLSNIKIFPHFMFYGHSGKRVLINLLIEHYFKRKIIFKKYNHYINSTYAHMEVNIKNITKTDDLIEFIMGYAKTKSIIELEFRLIVILYFNLLDNKTQYKLRTILEKLASNFRLIIHCSKFEKVIEPLRSRVLPIRIPQANNDEKIDFIKVICKDNKYKLSNIDVLLPLSINNIVEHLYIKLFLRENKSKIKIIDNKKDLLDSIIKELSTLTPKTIPKCKAIILKYLESGYEAEDMYKHILSHNMSYEMIQITAKYQHLDNGIMGLEAYIIYLLSQKMK